MTKNTIVTSETLDALSITANAAWNAYHNAEDAIEPLKQTWLKAESALTDAKLRFDIERQIRAEMTAEANPTLGLP